MSREFTATTQALMNAEESAECYATLITISHASLAEPLCFNNVGADVVSNGVTYKAFPFELVLFTDDEDVAPTAKMKIDNTDRRIVATIRGLRPAPLVAIKMVRTSAPNVVELQYPPIPLTDVSADVFTVEGTLRANDFNSEPFPGDTFNPALYPGMH